MFGMTMIVRHNGVTVKLRSFTKEDIPVLVEYFSSMKTHMNTMGIFGQTLENELEWYEKTRKDPECCTWAIQPEGSDELVGVTSLHGINSRENTCTSGIIIWRQDWWGKGVASAAHLGRTLFAADFLNRWTIRSSVRTANEASRRALERVGYTIWGTEPVCVLRGGEWLDTHHQIWIHPDHAEKLFNRNVPAIYMAGIELAKVALETARREVTFP